MTKLITRIAPDVGWLPISFANVYFLGRPGGKWIIVDTGLPGRAREIMEAAEARFGAGSRPEAIILTNGHTDHVGSALALGKAWDVSVFAHRLEMPYLSGKSAYPPVDPTVGGAIAFLSRFFPSHSHDLGEHLHQLQPGKVPGVTGWKWIATPGPSPGHISLFRTSDRVLIAGDALATMNMDSWSGLFTGKQALSRAVSPFTMDWEAARASVRSLAQLKPNVVGCGHGIPMCDSELPERMETFAKRFRPPRHGRYVRKAATTDENGVVDLPPAPFDVVPLATAASLVVAGIALGAGYLDDEKRK